MTVPSLFDPPAQHHSETSKEAAQAIKPTVETLRSQVFKALQAKSMTDQEIAETLGLPENTTRPRRIELVRAEVVVKAGKRKTRSGRSAHVWRARFRPCLLPGCGNLTEHRFCTPGCEDDYNAAGKGGHL